jgi:drug/metabolite transporter (DMT)-like permease
MAPLLTYTNASRMVVFIYLSPMLTALGPHFLVTGERLHPAQWAGGDGGVRRRSARFFSC